MTKIASLPTIATALLACDLSAAPAQAGPNRTWVSGMGTDSGPCTRAAPCRTFAFALTQTAAGGEIFVLDPAGYGPVTITKAISILNDGVGTAGIHTVSGNGGVYTPPESQPECDAFRLAKRLAIQHGFDGVEVPQPKGIVYSRADFVNEYWRPSENERRLDFQYYEHDLSRVETVVAETYAFTKSFQERTGYVPGGWATYFVRRLQKEKKPFGLYSGGPGVSFSFDPICSNPAEPLWQEFSREYNELAIHRLGANASPIQTQWLKKGEVRIPRKLAKPRFITPYFAQFLC